MNDDLTFTLARHHPRRRSAAMLECGRDAHEENWNRPQCRAEIERRLDLLNPTCSKASREAARSEWRIFTDPDVRPHIDFIERRVLQIVLNPGLPRYNALLVAAGRWVRRHGIRALAEWAP
jgi:hypothetical protein